MVFLIFAILLSSCASFQKLDPNTIYKRDIGLTVNGRNYSEGATAVPKADSYEMLFAAKGSLDLIMIQTCHRTFSAEKQSGGFLGLKENRVFKYSFVPNAPMETDRICPMVVQAFESSKEGRNSWAFIDFENPDWGIKYLLKCNGERYQINGVGVCQGKINTVQRLEFQSQVRFAPVSSGCRIPDKVGEKGFEIPVSRGECVYVFDNAEGQKGRVTFIGFEHVLLREGQ